MHVFLPLFARTYPFQTKRGSRQTHLKKREREGKRTFFLLPTFEQVAQSLLELWVTQKVAGSFIRTRSTSQHICREKTLLAWEKKDDEPPRSHLYIYFTLRMCNRLRSAGFPVFSHWIRKILLHSWSLRGRFSVRISIMQGLLFSPLSRSVRSLALYWKHTEISKPIRLGVYCWHFIFSDLYGAFSEINKGDRLFGKRRMMRRKRTSAEFIHRGRWYFWVNIWCSIINGKEKHFAFAVTILAVTILAAPQNVSWTY